MTDQQQLKEMWRAAATGADPTRQFPAVRCTYGAATRAFLNAVVGAFWMIFLSSIACNNKEKMDTFSQPTHGCESVFSIAFSPDGNFFVSAGSGGKIKILDWKNRATIKEFKAHNKDVYTIVFSPDGKLLASGGFDSLVKLWNTQDWKERMALKSYTSGIILCSFSASGRELASGEGAAGSQIIVWDVETGKRKAAFNGHAYGTHGLLFSQDGAKLISVGHDDCVAIHDVEGGKTVKRVKADPAGKSGGGIDCLARNPLGMEFATGSSDELIRFWDFSGNCIRTYKGLLFGNDAIAFSSDGKLLAVTGGEDPHATCLVKLLDVASGRECRILEGYTGVIKCLAFSPDGKTLAAGRINGETIFWDVQGQQSSGEPALGDGK